MYKSHSDLIPFGESCVALAQVSAHEASTSFVSKIEEEVAVAAGRAAGSRWVLLVIGVVLFCANMVAFFSKQWKSAIDGGSERGRGQLPTSASHSAAAERSGCSMVERGRNEGEGGCDGGDCK